MKLDDMIRAEFSHLGAISGILRTTYMGRPCVEFTVDAGESRHTYYIEVTESKAANENTKRKTP